MRKLRFSDREFEPERYAKMVRSGFKTADDRLVIFFKASPAGPSGPAQKAEHVDIRGTENIDRAIAEVTEALEPDEPDWYWTGASHCGLPVRRR